MVDRLEEKPSGLNIPYGEPLTDEEMRRIIWAGVDAEFAKEEQAGGKPPIVDITLMIGLQDIPEGPPCIACGSPTERVLMEHITQGISGVRVRAVNVSGYRCLEGDGVEFFSDRGVLESLTRASDIFRAKGDEETPRLLQLEIARLQSRIDLQDLR